MEPRPACLLVAVAMISYAAPGEAARIEVQHQPLPCAVADRFVRIAAKASPPARSAEVQFRTDPAGPWYALAMKAENGEWAAILPRPTTSLASFEYRIAMAGQGPETAESPTYVVNVGADASACGGPALSALSSSILVRVPHGAPAVPPVPRGFDPAGVVGTLEPAPKGSKKALVIGSAAAVAGGVAALALGGGSETVEPPDLPDFSLEGSIPAPGSTVSVSRDTIQVLVRMSREPPEPLTLDWRVEWRATAAGFICVTMAGTFNGAQRPTGLVLTGPFFFIPFCGTSFDAAFAHLVINARGHNAFAQLVPLQFRFVP